MIQRAVEKETGKEMLEVNRKAMFPRSEEGKHRVRELIRDNVRKKFGRFRE
jgi:hypothetical protein